MCGWFVIHSIGLLDLVLALVLAVLTATNAQRSTSRVPISFPDDISKLTADGQEIVLLEINVKEKPPPAITVSDDYWVQTDLEVPSWTDIKGKPFRSAIKTRLEKVLQDAFKSQQQQHFGHRGDKRKGSNVTKAYDVDVKILNITHDEQDESLAKAVYVVKLDNTYVRPEVVVKDVNLVSPEQQALRLGYVVKRHKPYNATEEESNAWIIAVIIGAILAILLCGWCLLFAYYNTCGRGYDEASRKRLTEEHVKTTEYEYAANGEQIDGSASLAVVPVAPTSLALPVGAEYPVAKVYVKDDNAQTEITSVVYERYIFDDLRTISSQQRIHSSEYETRRDGTPHREVTAVIEDTRKYQPHQTGETSVKEGFRTATTGNVGVQTSENASAADMTRSHITTTDSRNTLQVVTTDRTTIQINSQIEKRPSLVEITTETDSHGAISLSEGRRHQPLDLRTEYGDFSNLIDQKSSRYDEMNAAKIFTLSQGYTDASTLAIGDQHPRPRPTDDALLEGTLQFHTNQWRSQDPYMAVGKKDAQIRSYLSEVFRFQTVTARPCPLK